MSEIKIPIPPNEFGELVEPYDSSSESGSSNLSTVVPSEISRLIDIILQQDIGYTSKSDFTRDAVIKWLIILTESVKDPLYREYLIQITRMRAAHATQIRRTRQVKGEEFVAAASEELSILIENDEMEEALNTAVDHLMAISKIGGITSRVWKKTYLNDPIIKSHIQTLVKLNNAKAKILKGII